MGAQIPPEHKTATGARFDVSAQPGDWLATLAAAEEAIAVAFNTLVGPATVWTPTSPSSKPRTPVPATRVAPPGPDAARNKARQWHRSVWCVRGRRGPSSSNKAQHRATPKSREGQQGKVTFTQHSASTLQNCHSDKSGSLS